MILKTFCISEWSWEIANRLKRWVCSVCSRFSAFESCSCTSSNLVDVYKCIVLWDMLETVEIFLLFLKISYISQLPLLKLENYNIIKIPLCFFLHGSMFLRCLCARVYVLQIQPFSTAQQYSPVLCILFLVMTCLVYFPEMAKSKMD